MGELRTWAVPIGLVRQLVPASAELAPRLRTIASQTFRVPAAENRPMGLLAKLGPLVVRPSHAPVVPPGMPTHNDIENLLAGRFVTPERLEASWAAIGCWLDELSAGRLVLPLAPGELDQVEFDLTMAGLSSDHCPSRLLARDTQLVLRPLGGMRIGYNRNGFVLECAEAINRVLDDVEPRSRLAAGTIAAHLSEFAGWTRDAEQAGHPVPDLFAILR